VTNVLQVVNATVSQSVPGMVSTAVRAVAKLFAGEIIEQARMVQAEWIESGEQQSEVPAPPKQQPTKSDDVADELLNAAENSDVTNEDQMRRGPLRPDHLREAWKRYRFSGESRGVGMQQLWHTQQSSGVERFSTRTGKRIFK
jgi:transcription initiation factor TFIID subunit 11